ncbi:integrase [Pseudomonas putida]|uniref:integrase n=1 Tax=Pseudomonas putida TaxID=303 RepID=UPI003F8BF425
MNNNTAEVLNLEAFAKQPIDLKNIFDLELHKLIVTTAEIDGTWIILSRFGDDIWKLNDFPKNTPTSRQQINFRNVPPAFRITMKMMVYRYLRRGRHGCTRPKGSTTRELVAKSLPFLRHLEQLNIKSLAKVTPEIVSTYVTNCKKQNSTKSNKPLSVKALFGRLLSIEEIYELSQFTHQPMVQHPWPGTSAYAIAGGHGIFRLGLTPLMPDEVFCTLFEQAYKQVEQGHHLLSLRDDLDHITIERKHYSLGGLNEIKNRHLKDKNWSGGVAALSKSLINLRTACYIVLASTSGCRNHEIVNLQLGAHHRTEDDEGTVYHWMRSKSDKSEGTFKWMIPEAAVRALRIMERWSAPYRKKIADEIAQLRRTSPYDPQIAEAAKHRDSLFLGIDKPKGMRVRTVCINNWHKSLRTFAKDCGLNWKISSHQFRRKFANYVAHSKFGDLRYLREHFTHWSLDVTLGYAMDDTWGEHFDLELYDEILNELSTIKVDTVGNWMESDLLAGGYGRALKKWQRDPQNLLIFKDHSSMLKSISESTAIRSNGHAWCTADNDGCVGNSSERTRCNGCEHAVIGRSHAPMYQRLYNDLKELRNCPDIGDGGRNRVERDLCRSREVLSQFGIDPEV